KHFASRMSVWLAGISPSARRAMSPSRLEVGPERLLEVAERAQPRLDAAPLLALRADPRLLRAEVGPGGGDPVARRAELLPPARVLDAVVEVLGRLAPALRDLEARVGEVDRALDADRLRVAAGLARALVQRREVGAELLLAEPRVVGEPAVGEAPGALQHGPRLAAEPEPDRPLHRQRVDARGRDLVEPPLVGHDLPRPEQAQELDLLLHDLAAALEVDAERLVLDVVPARGDHEADASARQHVGLRGLLREQRGLPLRADQDARAELELLRERCKAAEEHERLVPDHVSVVERRLAEIGLPLWAHAEICAEHVVADRHVAVAELLERGEELRERALVGADQMLRQVGSELHHLEVPP